VITKHILKEMKQDSQLLSFEVNGKFCNVIREQIKDDRLHVIEDSAENLGKYLNEHHIKEVDYIISAIPFVSLPKDLSYRIVEVCKEHLKVGGLFIQVHYSLLTKKMYQDVFGNVDLNFVPINIPPAFVMVMEKK